MAEWRVVGLGGGIGWRRRDIGPVRGEDGEHLIDLMECEMVLLPSRGGGRPGQWPCIRSIPILDS